MREGAILASRLLLTEGPPRELSCSLGRTQLGKALPGSSPLETHLHLEAARPAANPRPGWPCAQLRRGGLGAAFLLAAAFPPPAPPAPVGRGDSDGLRAQPATSRLKGSFACAHHSHEDGNRSWQQSK